MHDPQTWDSIEVKTGYRVAKRFQVSFQNRKPKRRSKRSIERREQEQNVVFGVIPHDRIPRLGLLKQRDVDRGVPLARSEVGSDKGIRHGKEDFSRTTIWVTGV